MIKRGFRRAVPAPAGVGLDCGVGAEHHDGRARGGLQDGQGELGERQRREHVNLVDPSQSLERIVGQARQRRGPQRARVVHEQVQSPIQCRHHARRGARVGDVTRDGPHAGPSGGRRTQGCSVTSVDDAGPVLLGQRGEQRPPEPQ